MRLGVSSYLYQKNLSIENIIRTIGRLKFSSIEIGLGQTCSLDILSKYVDVNKILDQYSLRATVHFPYKLISGGSFEYFDIANQSKENPAFLEKFFTNICNFAQKINAEILVIHAGGEKIQAPSRIQAHSFLIESLGRLVQIAKQYDLVLALENSDARENRLCRTIEELDQVLERVDSDNLGLCFDTAHAFSCNLDVLSTVLHFKKNVVHFHLNDSEGGTGWKEHLPIGRGLIDWKGFFTLLPQINFSGSFILESGMTENKKDTTKALTEQRKFISSLI